MSDRKPVLAVTQVFGDAYGTDYYTSVPLLAFNGAMRSLGVSRNRRDVILALLSMRRRGELTVSASGQQVADRCFGIARNHVNVELAAMAKPECGWLKLLRKGRAGGYPNTYDVSDLLTVLAEAHPMPGDGDAPAEASPG